MSDKSSQIKMDINIVIIGAVSVGKSTFTNSLFVEQFSDMNIKRTTSLPQVYHETGETSYHSDTTKIRETNRIKNNEIMNKTIEESKLKLEDIYEVEYYVPPIFDLLETQIQRKNNIYLSIYDTPGLNDCGTKAVYYNYIEKIFYKYDIIIFMIDIFSSLNTSDEIEILEFLLNNMKKNKSDFDIENKLVILLNKCDELYVHKNTILPVDDEIKEMVIQAETIVKNKVSDIFPECIYTISCISCEDAYIYRMYKRNPDINLDIKYITKFGSNEFGKNKWNRLSDAEKHSNIKNIFNTFNYEECIGLTGFKHFEKILSEFLTNQDQLNYLLNHIKYDLINIDNKMDLLIIESNIYKFKNIKDNIDHLYKIFKNNTKSDLFRTTYTDYIYLCISYFSQFFNIIQNNSEYTTMLNIKRIFNICSLLLNDTYNVNEYIKTCNEYINNFNITVIEKYDLKHPDELLDIFNNFVNNEYNEYLKLIDSTISNLYKYKFDTKNISELYEKYIYILKEISKLYKIENICLVKSIFNILKNGYINNKEYSYYNLHLFLNKYYINSKCKYLKYIHYLKILLHKEINLSLFFLDVENNYDIKLEKYMFSLIKKECNNLVFNLDNISDKYYESFSDKYYESFSDKFIHRQLYK